MRWLSLINPSALRPRRNMEVQPSGPQLRLKKRRVKLMDGTGVVAAAMISLKSAALATPSCVGTKPRGHGSRRRETQASLLTFVLPGYTSANGQLGFLNTSSSGTAFDWNCLPCQGVAANLS